MNHGSLFSGIGGFDLAAEWMGWENKFHCEWNPFGQKILKHYWPHAASYTDISKSDFTKHRGQVDIITGGFPCQPFSLAGKQNGTEDDRYLWPEMLRAIKEVQPRWIVGENVPGIISQGNGIAFENICQELENEGYEVQPIIIPATAAGANHIRSRVWIIANSCIFADLQADKAVSTERSIRQTRGNDRWGDRSQIPSFNRSLLAPRVLRNLNGIPSGMDRNRGCGNAIVPHVAYKIFKTIEQYETQVKVA